MKSELIGVRNGIELYAPVAENEMEERELKAREDRFYNFMAEMFLKYWSKLKPEIEKLTPEEIAQRELDNQK